MAKLNGVKTLDMVNGEITKVAYDGAEYEKIAHDFRDAQTGDLFLNTVNGDYYEITIRESNFHGISHPVRFINDIGRDGGYMRACSVHPLFRKISADKPKRLTVGDYAKVIANDSSHHAEIGDIVYIVSDDNDHQPYKCERVSDGKFVGWFFERELEAYEKEMERPNKPKLKAGDFVTIESYYYKADITKGKPYEVREDSNGLYFLDDAGDVRRAVLREGGFSIVPPNAVKWAKIGRKVNEYRVGDIVRLTNDSLGGLLGYSGIITRIIDNDYSFVPYRLEKPDFVEDEANTWYQASDIELIAPVESTLN